MPTVDNPLRVLALGAGVQSSYLYLASEAGELPRLDVAIFSDTRYEPAPVYKHLDWLETQSSIPIIRCGVGDLRQDAIDFRQNRVSRDGKRWASVPFYVKNADGSRGQIRRQCTPTYKIEPMERVIREQLMGLRRGQQASRLPLIEQWIGISADEGQRCSFPGVYRTQKKFGHDLFGNKYVIEAQKKWSPLRWKFHSYPLCRLVFTSERKVIDCTYLPRQMQRQDCLDWLAERYPGREIPRSACIGCPYRSNEEWRRMRDTEPASWQEAIDFDRAIRIADLHGQNNGKHKMLVGLPFVHDSLIPLEMVNLDIDDGKRGAGCGIAHGIQGSFAGMCGV